MKIIDAHLHFATDAYFDEIAKAAEHENSADHLLEQYRMRGMVHGIVMGNLPVEELEPAYPPFLSYCIGLDSQVFDMAKLPQKLHLIEQHLKSERCVGIKLYPGYASFYLYDDRLAPVYELAARYKKPVTVHTGLTATDKALLKYSHPLVMDEAATKFREVQFVMCHFGEPWFTDAAAVIEKNPNVAADLSGLLGGSWSARYRILRRSARRSISTSNGSRAGSSISTSMIASCSARTGRLPTSGITSPSRRRSSQRSTGRKSSMRTPCASTI